MRAHVSKKADSLSHRELSNAEIGRRFTLQPRAAGQNRGRKHEAARNGQHLPIDAQPSGRQECDNLSVQNMI